MNADISLLLVTAISIGFFHTLTGPDHYVPFIMMAQTGKWSLKKTTWITFLCGIGHVGSSVIIGAIGIATGIAVAKLELVEGYRGSVAAWLFILFGFIYFMYGMWRALKNKHHRHLHVHDGGIVHAHHHEHSGETHQKHEHKTDKTRKMTPWVLFTIFVFGPCEPLIPLLMYPAAQSSYTGMALVTGVFTFATIGTMLTVVWLGIKGINLIPLHKVDRYMHAIAGATILICGLAIEFLGL